MTQRLDFKASAKNVGEFIKNIGSQQKQISHKVALFFRVPFNFRISGFPLKPWDPTFWWAWTMMKPGTLKAALLQPQVERRMASPTHDASINSWDFTDLQIVSNVFFFVKNKQINDEEQTDEPKNRRLTSPKMIFPSFLDVIKQGDTHFGEAKCRGGWKGGSLHSGEKIGSLPATTQCIRWRIHWSLVAEWHPEAYVIFGTRK